MKKLKIKGFETPRFGGQLFALLSKKEYYFKILCDFSSCRGWMSDKLHVTKTGGNVYNKEDFDLKKGYTYIGISFNSEPQKEVFLRNLQILHSKETLSKVRKTVLYDTGSPLVLVAEGSRFWKDSCWKLQLYTFYLRSICYVNIEEMYPKTWLKLKHKDNELILLSKLKDPVEIFAQDIQIHSQTGPDAICTGVFNGNLTMAKHLGVTPC